MIAVCTHNLTHNVPRIKTIAPYRNAKQVSWMCNECADSTIRGQEHAKGNPNLVDNRAVVVSTRNVQFKSRRSIG